MADEVIVGRFVRAGILLFTNTVVVSFLGYVFWFSVSLFADPSDIGYATTAISLAGMAGGLLGFGLDYALIREVPTGLSRGDRRYAAQCSSTALILEAMLALGISVPIILFPKVTASIFYGEAYIPYLYLGLAFLALSMLGFVARATLVGLIHVGWILAVSLIANIVKIFLGVLLVVWGFGGLGIMLAFIAYSLIISLTLLTLTTTTLGFARPKFNIIKPLLKVGTSNYAGSLSNIIANYLAILLLAGLTGSAINVGIFYMVTLIFNLLSFLPGSLAMILLPLLRGSSDENLTTYSLRFGLAVVAPIIAVTLAYPSWIMGLLGEGYIAAGPLLFWLSLAVPLRALLSNAVSLLNHQNKLRSVLALGVLQLGVLTLSFLSLIPGYGIIGATWSLAASASIAGLASIIYLKVHLSSSWRGILAAGASIAISIAIGALDPQPIIGVPLALLTGLGIVFASKAITIGEVKSLLKLIIIVKR